MQDDNATVLALANHLTGEGQDMTARQAVEDFIEEQRLRNNRPATIAYYSKVLDMLLEQTGAVEMEDITRRTLTRWRLDLQERDLSPATVQTYDKAVKIFLAWAARNNIIEENPRQGMPGVRVPRGTGEYVTFTHDDVKAMLAIAEKKGHPNKLRDRAIIATLLDAGIRVGELSSLTLPNIQWKEHSIRVTGKTGQREVPALTCLRHLRRYVEQERRARPGVAAAFTSRVGTQLKPNAVTHVVRGIAADAEVGATKTGPHTFRHTFAVEYLRNGGDVFSLARILGHSELETTQRYVHWVMGDVQDLHAQHSPGGRWL